MRNHPDRLALPALIVCLLPMALIASQDPQPDELVAQYVFEETDPCDDYLRRTGRRMPGCDKPTAGDRWSADQAAGVRLQFPKEELRFLEVDVRGNIIIRGQAELVVNFDDVENAAVYADMAGMEPESIDKRLAGEIGSRCAASVRALSMRELGGDGATVVCMPDSKLYDALNPPPSP